MKNYKVGQKVVFKDNGASTERDISDYFKLIAKNHPQISVDERVMSGIPVIKGTRIPITTILQYLLDGEDLEALQEDFSISELDYLAMISYLMDLFYTQTLTTTLKLIKEES